MGISEGKVFNSKVGIHYLVSQVDANKLLPLIIIPGLSESAEDYIDIIKGIDDRKCVAISLRGRGKSDSPESGYKLSDHISDIEKVADALELKEFILMGYSRGVSYMLGYALKHIEKVKGVIIGDYPAIHTKLSEQWTDMFVKLPPWRGKTASERMNRFAIEAIQRESEEKSFYDDLYKFKIPVLIVSGGKEGSILSTEMKEQYLKAVQNIEIIVFEDCDHNIFEPDINQLIDVIKKFLGRL